MRRLPRHGCALLALSTLLAGCAKKHGGAEDADNEPAVDAAVNDGESRAQLGDADFRESCGLSLCDLGERCCYETGACVEPGTDCPATAAPVDVPASPPQGEVCTSLDDCADGEFCDAPTCLGPGVCVPLNGGAGICQEAVDLTEGLSGLSSEERTYLDRLSLICACDGQNWPSECAALEAGVRVNSSSSLQPCAGTLGDKPPGLEDFADTGGRVTANVCSESTDCDGGSICCNVTRTCMTSEAQCFIPRGPGYPCLRTEDCGGLGDAVCVRPGCADRGYCIDRREYEGLECDAQRIVCGCDGLTYIDRCAVVEAGQTIASLGECP